MGDLENKILDGGICEQCGCFINDMGGIDYLRRCNECCNKMMFAIETTDEERLALKLVIKYLFERAMVRKGYLLSKEKIEIATELMHKNEDFLFEITEIFCDHIEDKAPRYKLK